MGESFEEYLDEYLEAKHYSEQERIQMTRYIGRQAIGSAEFALNILMMDDGVRHRHDTELLSRDHPNPYQGRFDVDL